MGMAPIPLVDSHSKEIRPAIGPKLVMCRHTDENQALNGISSTHRTSGKRDGYG